MKVDEVQFVLVVGAGAMGQQIGLQCAMHGYSVVLYDIAQKKLDDAMVQIKTYAAQFVDERRLTQAEASATLARITLTTRAEEAASQADLLSEAVPETPKLKREVFVQFNKLCPPRTIFTTNTSMLLPSMLHKATGRPAQFAALHFHKDVWVTNVVDIMPHKGTSDETVTLLMEFAKRIGQIPFLLKKEKSGYIFNSLWSPVVQEALALVANGVASVEGVDRVWMMVMKMPIGPFGIMDFTGIDIIWDSSNFWLKKYFFLPRQLRRNVNFLKEYVDKGKIGIKSGQGFYIYPNPAYRKPGFVEGSER